MLGLTGISWVAVAMLQAGAEFRQDYVSCLNSAVASAQSANIGIDAFGDYAHKSCASIEQGFRAKLVAFNVKNGMSKKIADEDAQIQLDDYVYTAREKYRYAVQPPN